LVFPTTLASRWLPGLFPEENAGRSGHDLKFPRPGETYSFDREVVIFWGQDEDMRVRCEISREALDDHFDGDNKDPLAAFRTNREAIEQEVRRKYVPGKKEKDGSAYSFQ
jgi:hypothetical protein